MQATSKPSFIYLQRSVFNAVCGNDDDHVRNHAVRYDPSQRCWRLSPAYDVVPNVAEAPRTLAMQTASGRYDISRQAILQEAWRFGFASHVEAAAQLDHLLDLIAAQAPQHVHGLSAAWRAEMLTRIAASIALLRPATAG